MKISKTILRSIFFVVFSVSVCWSLDFNLTKTVNLNGNPAYAHIAQLDPDPMMEVVCPPTQSGPVCAFDHDGTLLWTFQTGWYGDIDVADVNGDVFGEIGVISADRHFYYLDHNGNQLWVYTIRELGHGKPSFCQLDSDNNLEVVCGEWDSNTNSAHIAYAYALDPEQKKLICNGIKQIREVLGGGAWFGQNDFRLEFGLGNVTIVDSISDADAKFRSIEADDSVEITGVD